MSHVSPKAREVPVQSSAVFKNGRVETVALVMVRLTDPPVFSTVNVVEVKLPTVTLPKSLVAGVMLPVTVGPAVPVPVKDEILVETVGCVGDDCKSA
jgi:hypothetical protein